MYVLGCTKLGMYFQCSHSRLEKECGSQDACVLKGTRKGDAEVGIVQLPDFQDLLQTWLASAKGHDETGSRNTSDHPEHTEVHRAITWVALEALRALCCRVVALLQASED